MTIGNCLLRILKAEISGREPAHPLQGAVHGKKYVASCLSQVDARIVDLVLRVEHVDHRFSTGLA